MAAFVDPYEESGGFVDPSEIQQKPTRLDVSNLPPLSESMEWGRRMGEKQQIGFLHGLDTLLSGIKQMYLEQISPEEAKKYTAEKDAELRAYEAALAREPSAEAGAMRTGQMAAEIGAGFAVPGGPAKAIPRIAYAMGTGGALRAAQYQEGGGEDKRLEEFGKGAALSGALSGAVELAKAAPKAFVKRMETPTAKEMEAVAKETGVPLGPGQKSGSANISEFERAALSGDYGQKVLNERNLAAEKYLSDVSESLSKQKLTPEQMAVRMSSAFKTEVSKWEGVRERVARVDYGRFKKAIGDQPVVRPDGLMSTLQEISSAAAPGSPAAKVAAKVNLKALESQMKSGNGAITAEQFLNWRSKISSGLAGKSEIFDALDSANQVRLSSKLMESLNTDIQNTSRYLQSVGRSDAAGLLNTATRNYARASEQIDKYRNSAIAKLFGEEVFDPSKIGRAIDNFTPTQAREANNLLSRNQSALNDYQAYVINRAIEKSSKDPAIMAGMSKLNPAEVLKSLPGRANLEDYFPDKMVQGKIKTGLKMLDALSDKVGLSTGAGRTSAGSLMVEAAGTATTMEPAFVARFSAKILSPLGLRKLIIEDEGYTKLRKLAAMKPRTTAFSNAILEMNDYLGREEQ